MPTQQAYDGDTLEAALARVTAECGPRARITQAEKVRTGGFAGFFARERYEVVVEVDDPADPVRGDGPVSQPSEPMSLLDLVEQVSEAERTAMPAEPCPVPSTEGPTFQQVLRAIATQSGLIGAPAHDGSDEAMADADVAAPVEPDIAPVTEPGIEPVDHVADEVSSDEPALDLYRPPVVERPAVPEPVGPEPVVPAPEASDAQALHRALGIPAALVEREMAAPTLAQQLLGVLEGIEPAPPVLAQRGQVVAVVGSGCGALDAARVLAEQLGQTLDDVVVAGPHEHGFHTVSDAASAEQRASLWRRCGVPFVVAVCAPEGRAGTEWARSVLEALDPVSVWGAVTAERKPEDITAWAEAVGGVDALAVSGCDRTASPAAVLATGLPVATIDGRRATPAAWTAMLVERLTV